MSANTSRKHGGKIALMIAGAQKAGTTSLKNYLGQHPDLQTHYQKEFAYFVDNSDYKTGYDTALEKYFPDHFGDELLVAKSAGLYINEQAVERLKKHNPECKLVLILRNPVERTYSSYLMEKNYGAIAEPFEVIEDIIQNHDVNDWRYEFFIGMSLYSRNLRMIFKHFAPGNIKIVRYEDLANNATAVCKDIFGWMEVDTKFTPDTSVRYNETRKIRSQRYGKFLQRVLKNSSRVKKVARTFLRGRLDYKVGEAMRNLNKTEAKHEPIPERTMKKLIGFFEPFNKELSELSGIDFSDWNKSVNGNSNGVRD